MLAPVYRNIETKTSFLGVGLGEVMFLMTLSMILLMSMQHNEAKAMGLTLAAYAAIRLINSGRAPAFAQHWCAFQLRRAVSGGFFSAAARSRCPRFPHAPYLSRDVAPMESPRRGLVSS